MIRKLFWLLFVSLMLQGAAVAATKMVFGVSEYGGLNQCVREAEMIGVHHCVSYVRVGKDGGIAALKTPKGWGVTLAVKFPEVSSGTVHGAIVSGVFDRELLTLAQQVNQAGRPVLFRLMPEPNGWWNFDAVYRPGQDHQTYNDAMHYVKTFLQRHIAPALIVGFELNLNHASFPKAGKPSIGTADFHTFVDPRLQYDLVTFPAYNRCGTDKHFKTIRPLEVAFDPAYQAARELFPKETKFGVSEMASSPYCDVDLMKVYSNMMQYLAAKDDVISVMFFFEDKEPGGASNQRNTQWGAVLELHPNEIRALVAEYKRPATPVPESTQSNTSVGEKGEEEAWKHVRAPLSFHASVSVPFDETDNPAFNPTSGESFGKVGPLFRSNVKQRVLWEVADGVETGPGLRLGLVESPDNNQQWWNNQVNAEVSFGLYGKLPKKPFDWGNWSLELVAGRTKFTTGATPDRYSGGDDSYAGVRFTINGEVDLAR